MDSFKIEGINGYIQININEVFDFPNRTSAFGGYDAKGTIDIKTGNYRVIGELWLSTGEIYNFYISLKESCKNIVGQAQLITTERNLILSANFDKFGHVLINGEYQEIASEENKLLFEINSDQSYLLECLNSLEKIFKKYGGNKGVNDIIQA